MKASKGNDLKLENKELSQIDLWKQEYGKIFKSIIGDDDYIFRRIKRQEYSQIMAIRDGEDVEERIFNRQVAIAKATVLNVEEDILMERMNELAGLAPTISDEVLNKSGFQLIATMEL